MKKIVFVFALGLASLSAVAQENVTEEVMEVKEEASAIVEETEAVTEEVVEAKEEATEAVAEEVTEAVEETTEEVVEVKEEATEAVVEEATEEVVATETENEFSEITSEALPQEVAAAVAKNYPTANIDKAFSNTAQQYKLLLSLQDGTVGTLYADEKGNWIEM